MATLGNLRSSIQRGEVFPNSHPAKRLGPEDCGEVRHQLWQLGHAVGFPPRGGRADAGQLREDLQVYRD